MSFIGKSIELFFKAIGYILSPIVYVIVYIVGLVYYSIIFLVKDDEE